MDLFNNTQQQVHLHSPYCQDFTLVTGGVLRSWRYPIRIATMASIQAIAPKMIVMFDSEPSSGCREGMVVAFEVGPAELDGNGDMTWITCWLLDSMGYSKEADRS
jgi:hypothetical protein